MFYKFTRFCKNNMNELQAQQFVLLVGVLLSRLKASSPVTGTFVRFPASVLDCFHACANTKDHFILK